MTASNKDIILIVDDDPTSLEILFNVLRRAGFEVLVAQDGESACRRVEHIEPDLILLDVVLPGKNGFETAVCLKAKEKMRDVPIIFLTALDDITHKIRGFEVGGVDYITKPLHVKEALARINTHLTLRKLQRQAETAAAVEERNRLARELHDSVTQTLYSLTMYADAACLALTAGRGQAAQEHVEALRGLAREAMRDMRLLVFELRPPILEKIGLVAAIQSRLDSVEARSNYQTQLIVEGNIQLPPSIELELYRITQEALNNVVKHAQAQQVTVKLHFNGQHLQLTVQDDGQGFDLSTAQQRGGLGLRSIQERVKKLNGALIIKSALGQGATLKIELTV